MSKSVITGSVQLALAHHHPYVQVFIVAIHVVYRVLEVCVVDGQGFIADGPCHFFMWQVGSVQVVTMGRVDGFRIWEDRLDVTIPASPYDEKALVRLVLDDAQE